MVIKDERFARVERQLAVAQQITHIGSWEWDVRSNVVTWSDEMFRIYGLDPAHEKLEVTFEYFLSRVHTDDRKRVQREVGRALEHGSTFAFRERVVRPDGTIRELDTLGEVSRDASGRATGLIGTCRDVTEERKRDETIQLYADIVRHVQIGLAVWDVGDPADPATIRLVAYNPAAEPAARRTLSDAIGKTFREIFPYGAGASIEGLILDVARDGQVRGVTIERSRNPRDPTRALAAKAFPLPGCRVGVAVDDITAATRTRRLQDAEHRILEMIATGADLPATLGAIVAAIQDHSPPAVATISLADGDGGDGHREGDRGRSTSAPILATDGRALGTFELSYPEPRAATPEDAALVARATHLAGIAIQHRQLEEQLRDLSAHVESVREDERTGIAREIHDELGQALTALKMDLAWIGRRISGDSAVSEMTLLEKVQAMSRMTDEVIHQVRRISAELRPGALDDLGLLAAIEWQASEFEQRTGALCLVESGVGLGDDSQLPRHLATAAFRIFQEALTNVARHANATHVDVRLEIVGDRLRLEVCDDGKGITPGEAQSPKSLGLLGVRERARRLGGTATVRPGPSGGTVVALELPLPSLGGGS
jgi:PAS domain S-box-containing protein